MELPTIATVGFRLYQALDHLAGGIESAGEGITLVALHLKAIMSEVGTARKSSTACWPLLVQRCLATIPGLVEQSNYVFQKTCELLYGSESQA